MPYTVIISNHEVKDDKVVYTICITDTETSNSRLVKYRYSQLKDFHSELEEILNKLQLYVEIPMFPKRKLFGATNKSEESINERKSELVEYLNKLVSIQKLHNLELFKTFFLPDPIESKKTTKQLEGGTNVQMYIDRYTIAEDVVLYYVRLRDLDTKEEWVFKYRYSDFRNLHEALQKSKIRFLPEFPKRKIFGITNDSPQDIEKRREELERYFNEIFSSKELIGNSIVKFFIQDTKKQAEKELELERVKKEKLRAQ